MKASLLLLSLLLLTGCASNKEDQIKKQEFDFISTLGGLTKEAIDSTVKSHSQELEECYNQAKERNENVNGKIALSWTVVFSGSVKDAKIIENKTGDSLLPKCFISKLNTWKFPLIITPTLSKDFSAIIDYYPFTLK